MGARPLASRQSSTVIVGSSPATVRLRSEIDRIAPFSSNVLVTGPSGTGKELVARQIHARSPAPTSLSYRSIARRCRAS